jgi:hypothetical protein
MTESEHLSASPPLAFLAATQERFLVLLPFYFPFVILSHKLLFVRKVRLFYIFSF